MLLLFWVPLWLLSVSTVVSIFSWYCLHSSATPHFYRGIQWQRWFRDFARRRDPTFKIRVRDLKKNFPEDETERKNDKSETPRPIKNTSKIGPKFSETRVFLGSILYLFLWSFTCFVPVRRLPRPSRSMYFGDVSRTNGRVKLARSTWPETHRPRAIMRPRRDPNGSLRAR